MPKNKGGKKAKKDPNKPKRAMSSFMFFANDRRNDIKSANPELKVTEIGKKLGEIWQSFGPEEKKKYEDMAAKDSERYQKQIENYHPPETGSSSDEDKPSKKKRKKNKDPNRPKRSLSSFMFFANENRKSVKEKFPDLKMTEIGKKLADEWNSLTPDGKTKYEQMAAKDKERYLEALRVYEATSPSAAKPVSAAPPARAPAPPPRQASDGESESESGSSSEESDG